MFPCPMFLSRSSNKSSCSAGKATQKCSVCNTNNSEAGSEDQVGQHTCVWFSSAFLEQFCSDLSSSRRSPTSQEEIDLSQQQESAARAAAQAEATSQKDKATIEALEKRIEEIEREKLRLLTENKFLNEQLVKVKEGKEVYEYGLSRGNLLDREWHKKNPRAAKHFFGFKDWKDTVVMLHGLFDVLQYFG